MSFKILVVDDEPDLKPLMLQYFRRRISKDEMEFAFAGTGPEALEVLSRAPDFDVVLCDINLPGMDGLTLLSRIGELDLPAKVVIVSAYSDMPNIRAAMNLGAFDFLTKPVDFLDLDVTLAKAQRGAEELREARRSRTRSDPSPRRSCPSPRAWWRSRSSARWMARARSR